jgi:hypothetical protein
VGSSPTFGTTKYCLKSSRKKDSLKGEFFVARRCGDLNLVKVVGGRVDQERVDVKNQAANYS